MSLNRRTLLTGSISLTLAGCASGAAREKVDAFSEDEAPESAALTYAPMPQEKFPIPAVDLRKLPRKYRRQLVDFQTTEMPGTVLVNTKTRFLHLVMENGKAMRYGVGIGREGFSWQGRARIAWKREWPRWTPPAEMIERQPELEPYRYGMEPGLENPLGARAMYIFEGNRDTLYRLHGTQEVGSIGRAVSSGCVRLINQDVIDLYNRVRPGAMVVVSQGDPSMS